MPDVLVPSATATKKLSLRGIAGELLQDGNTSRDRLQALLAQWLRMENVVLLTGAGCSLSRGGALMSQLENDVLNAVIDICKDDSELTQSRALVERRQEDVASETATSFERWLSLLCSSLFLLASGNSPVETVTFRESLKVEAEELGRLIKLIGQVITLRCCLPLPSLTVSPTGHHALIAKLLARDAALGRASLFTLNYDTLIEQALDDLSVQYSDGFVGTVTRRFDPSCYGLDTYYPGDVSEGRVRRFDKFVHLFKLHGSIHWRQSKTGRLLQRVPRPTVTFAEWQSLNAADKIAALTLLGFEDDEVISILPTENKFVQTLGMPYAHLFRAFHQKLQAPQTFLAVVGYSFGDEHVNAVIDDALSNPSLVLLVVDPKPSPMLLKRLERYQRSGDRAFLLESTFEDFTIDLLPHVQWLDDFVRLRKSEKTISSGTDS